MGKIIQKQEYLNNYRKHLEELNALLDGDNEYDYKVDEENGED